MPLVTTQPMNASDPMSLAPPLSALEHHDQFMDRHIGPDAAEQAEMLRLIGQPSLAALT